MNHQTLTIFQRQLNEYQQEYREICEEIESYKNTVGITSHVMGDKHYYTLCIKKWETYRKIKRIEAIIHGGEFAYIRQHKPVIQHKLDQLHELRRRAPIHRGDIARSISESEGGQ